MSKPKRKKPPRRIAAPSADQPPPAPDDSSLLASDDRIFASNLTLHQLFQQQVGEMLERAD